MIKKSERKEAWFRIIVAIVSGLVLEVWAYLIGVLTVLNWLVTLFKNKRNRELAEFSEYWNTEVYRYVRYLTGMTNERPFPFTSMRKMSKFQ